jgi:hypothetical protein
VQVQRSRQRGQGDEGAARPCDRMRRASVGRPPPPVRSDALFIEGVSQHREVASELLGFVTGPRPGGGPAPSECGPTARPRGEGVTSPRTAQSYTGGRGMGRRRGRGKHGRAAPRHRRPAGAAQWPP